MNTEEMLQWKLVLERCILVGTTYLSTTILIMLYLFATHQTIAFIPENLHCEFSEYSMFGVCYPNNMTANFSDSDFCVKCNTQMTNETSLTTSWNFTHPKAV